MHRLLAELVLEVYEKLQSHAMCMAFVKFVKDNKVDNIE